MKHEILIGFCMKKLNSGAAVGSLGIDPTR